MKAWTSVLAASSDSARATSRICRSPTIEVENRQHGLHGRRRWNEPTSWGDCRQWLPGCVPCRQPWQHNIYSRYSPTIPSPTPTTSSSLRFRVRNHHPKLQSLYLITYRNG